MKRPAAKANQAADALLAWLSAQRAPVKTEIGKTDETRRAAAPATSEAQATIDAPVANRRPAIAPSHPTGPLLHENSPGDRAMPRTAILSARQHRLGAGAPLELPHTDWLHHRLTVTGPRAALAAFRAAAAGAGTVPWYLDLDRMEEDWFHLLVSPPSTSGLPAGSRSLSLTGARILAGQLREAVARRHDRAVARVGRSQACPFDLHALVPVPDTVLRLGPDHPAAVAWLWEHWGTTQTLRHVIEELATDDEGNPRRGSLPDKAAWRLTFWSADWTPWRALAQLGAHWPMLHFDTRPTYGRP